MIMSLTSIQKAIDSFKFHIENSISEGGVSGKTSIIRSQIPILNLHEAVKIELIRSGINKDLIFPHLDQRTPELTLAGSIKQKQQDVCVIPNFERIPETLKEGLIEDVIDKYGVKFTEETISINAMSQISSIQKNFDTLHERTTSESTNLHDRCPKMCLGEVYMIAIPEYEYQKNN